MAPGTHARSFDQQTAAPLTSASLAIFCFFPCAITVLQNATHPSNPSLPHRSWSIAGVYLALSSTLLCFLYACHTKQHSRLHLVILVRNVGRQNARMWNVSLCSGSGVSHRKALSSGNLSFSHLRHDRLPASVVDVAHEIVEVVDRVEAHLRLRLEHPQSLGQVVLLSKTKTQCCANRPSRRQPGDT